MADPQQPFKAALEGDRMLQWATLGAAGRRFELIVHHDDAGREHACDRESHAGRLDQAPDVSSTMSGIGTDGGRASAPWPAGTVDRGRGDLR